MQEMHECKNARMQEIARMLRRTRLTRVASAFLHFCILCIFALLVSACASAQAKGAAAGPPLDVPAPPSRVVEPIVAEVPPPLPLPEDPRPAPVRPVRPAAAAPSAARPETPRTDAAAAEPPKAEEPPKPPTTPTTLQTTTAAAEGEVERGIRATLTRATADLGRINYRALNAEARAQYDTARRFIQQADEAIRQKNLVLAKNLADKAAGIAAQQAGR
jgi:hypothetical protein